MGGDTGRSATGEEREAIDVGVSRPGSCMFPKSPVGSVDCTGVFTDIDPSLCESPCSGVAGGIERVSVSGEMDCDDLHDTAHSDWIVLSEGKGLAAPDEKARGCKSFCCV